MPLFIKVAIFSDVYLVSNHHGCIREALKLISYCKMMLFTKLYIITFEKIANQTKYKKPNIRSHLNIF